MAAERLTVDDILYRIDHDEFGLSSDDESDFEGDGVFSYLPPPLGNPLDSVAGEGEPREGQSESDGEYSGAASSAPSRGHSPGKKEPSSSY